MITDNPTDADNDRLGRLTFECIGYRRGTWFYAAWSEAWHVPIGMAFVTRHGSEKGRTVSNLGHIYVMPEARRRKVATRLIARVLDDCDQIVTPAGSEDGGRELIKSMGFAWSEPASCWHLDKATTENPEPPAAAEKSTR